MNARYNSRGGPLIALGLILGSWVAMRVVLWDSAALTTVAEPPVLLAGSGEQAPASPVKEEPPATARSETALDTSVNEDNPDPAGAKPAGPGRQPPWPGRGADRPASSDYDSAPVPFAKPVSPAPAGRVPVHIAAGHQSLWMAALARLPMPSAIAARHHARALPVPFYAAGREPSTGKRWSGDAWLLVRRGSGGAPAGAASPSTYGASQAGAVVRYRLAPDSRHKPTAYVRATAALRSASDEEAALGVSARPFPAVPVVAAAELRVSNLESGTDVRPAAMVVTEIAPFDLPHGLRGEAYAQAGYVGGRFKTAFADGQVRIDRQVARIGKSDLRAGGGAWAGAQKGAKRVDIGPTATLGVPVGESASARLGVDWRLRVAGDARPRSGPAVTLSAGF